MFPAHRLNLLLFVFSILTVERSFAQTVNLAAQEDKFVKLYSKVLSSEHSQYDSLEFYSNKFEEGFASFIKNNPGTANYPFKKLIDSFYCFIITSGDGNFRVYSWDTWMGGTMHFYRIIYQWKANGKVFTEIPKFEDNNPGFFCSKIFTVNINDKPHYFTVTDGTYSTKDAMQAISCYRIDGNKLTDTIKVFKTKTKKLNDINVFYDFFSVVDRPERPIELITYDDKLKIIYIPVVDDKDQVTKKNILYQLKDRYFEFIGIETGKRE